VVELIIVSDYPVTNPPTGSDNDTRYLNKHIDELFKFHANDLSANGTIMHQHAIQAFRSQASDAMTI
jgi:hypothetical protein